MSADDGWDRDKPWTAPAQHLVLYRTESGWFFAVHSCGGILDGHLADVEREANELAAMAALIEKVSSATGRRYVAHWEAGEPDWWTAEVDLLPDPPQ